jgi:sterol-4alpha-carboxylate 3-dehydrogenase (decarboxylating)
MPDNSPLLGPVLVAGGCGFLGQTLVSQLLSDPECGPVYVVDRDTDRNCHAGAHYTQGSITDRTVMSELLASTSPRVVFHLASPNFSFPVRGRSDFHKTNVEGTQVLLDLCNAAESVRAFVYCSSVDAYADPPHENVGEDHPLCSDTFYEAYARTKAIADRLVLASNSPQLRTVSMRVSHVYGEGCTQQLPILLGLCAGNMPLFQLGSGTNMLEVVSSDNAAALHILGAKALLDPTRANGKVDGEAFNVSDGVPQPFWHHIVQFWSAARGRNVKDELIVFPDWLVRVIFFLAGWIVWIFTLGMMEPPSSLSWTTLTHSLEHHTYSSAKARERLGFNPPSDHDAVIKTLVEDEMRRRELAAESKKDA